MLNAWLRLINDFTMKLICKIFKIDEKNVSRCSYCNRLYILRSNKNDKWFCCKKHRDMYHDERFQSFKNSNYCKKHPDQRMSFKNQCWSCYRQSFEIKIENISFFKIRKMLGLHLFHHFYMVPTFRNSENSWNGDKIAFEQYLKELGVKWFVYIKFYVDKKRVYRPLVVGKSGSMLVNASGSDLNFSTDVNDGPARKFLKSNHVKWNYDFIAVRKCKNESDAYKIETMIMNKYNLFGS